MSATLTEAEEGMVTFVPVGYRYFMLLAAFTKYVLANLKMPAGTRLNLLEKLNALVDGYFSQEMLSAIQPMCPTQVEMICEAKLLDPAGDKLGNASFEILTGEKVFRHFIALNPSFLDAIKIRDGAFACTLRAQAATVGSEHAEETGRWK
jgi:hypothetical protein